MQPKCSEVDFRGQDIYVGIDVGKRSWKVCIVTEYVEHRVFTQPPTPAMLANYLHRTFPGARYHSAYEAGFSGFWAHEELQALGIDSRVVNPADVPTTQKEKSFKTDRIDARKLARSLRSGELRPIYVPPKEAQTYRSLLEFGGVDFAEALEAGDSAVRPQLAHGVVALGLGVAIEGLLPVADAEEGRLQDVQVAFVHQGVEETEEIGDHQVANVEAVDVGVRGQHHLVVAEAFEVVLDVQRAHEVVHLVVFIDDVALEVPDVERLCL